MRRPLFHLPSRDLADIRRTNALTNVAISTLNSIHGLLKEKEQQSHGGSVDFHHFNEQFGTVLGMLQERHALVEENARLVREKLLLQAKMFVCCFFSEFVWDKIPIHRANDDTVESEMMFTKETLLCVGRGGASE